MQLTPHIYHYRALVAFLWLPLLAPQPRAAAQSGLGVSPMRLEFKMTPGTQRSGSLTLAGGAANTRFRTEILDFYIDKEAQPQFVPDVPAESQFSCRQWLTVNPMEAEISGGGQMLARYTIRVPAGVPDRSYHCAVGFTTLPGALKQQTGAIGMLAAIRVICTFYIVVGDSAPEGELKEITLEKYAAKGTSGLRALLTVENTGLVNLRGAGKVELLDASGKVMESEDFPSNVILPKRRQIAPVPLKHKLADGEYTLRVQVNLGTGEIQEATLAFKAPLPAQ